MPQTFQTFKFCLFFPFLLSNSKISEKFRGEGLSSQRDNGFETDRALLAWELHSISDLLGLCEMGELHSCGIFLYFPWEYLVLTTTEDNMSNLG